MDSETKDKITNLEQKLKESSTNAEIIKSDLQNQIVKILLPVREKFDKEKSADEEIDRMAQNREWAKDLYD